MWQYFQVFSGDISFANLLVRSSPCLHLKDLEKLIAEDEDYTRNEDYVKSSLFQAESTISNGGGSIVPTVQGKQI